MKKKFWTINNGRLAMKKKSSTIILESAFAISLSITMSCKSTAGSLSDSLASDISRPTISREAIHASFRTTSIPSPISCASGQPMTLGLADSAFTIATVPTGVKLADFVTIEKPSDIQSSKIRIDICVANDGTPTFMKLVIKNAETPFSPANFLEIATEGESVDAGFQEFIFGDYTKLNLLFVMPDSKRAYLLGGVQQGSDSFVFYSEGDMEGNILKANSLVAGLSEAANPFKEFDGRICGFEEKHLLVSETLSLPTGKISIEREICRAFVFGTNQETLIKVIVTNLLPSVDANEIKMTLTNFTDPNAAPYFMRNTVHHNVCTSWFLKMPYGIFGYTGLTRAGNIGGGTNLMGCPSLVNGAPTISPTTETTAKILEYSYQGQPKASLPSSEIQTVETSM